MSNRYPNNAMAKAVANYIKTVEDFHKNNPFIVKDENADQHF